MRGDDRHADLRSCVDGRHGNQIIEQTNNQASNRIMSPNLHNFCDVFGM